MPKKKTWSGRFSEPVDELVKRFTASVSFDQRLPKYVIEGSLAHARMLAARGILPRRDLAAIERRLTALAGDAGKRLHTARSRNDQVATDLRLWLRAETDQVLKSLAALQRALLAQAGRHAALVMPGFTHLQVAQPVTFGHHLLA